MPRPPDETGAALLTSTASQLAALDEHTRRKLNGIDREGVAEILPIPSPEHTGIPWSEMKSSDPTPTLITAQPVFRDTASAASPCSTSEMQQLFSKMQKDLLAELVIAVKAANQEALSEHCSRIAHHIAQATKAPREAQVQPREPEQPQSLGAIVHGPEAQPEQTAVSISAGEGQNNPNAGVYNEGDGTVCLKNPEEARLVGSENSIMDVQSAQATFGRGSTWITQHEERGNRMVDTHALLKSSGCCRAIVDTHLFHGASLLMICFNAVYIGIDADWNHAKTLQDSAWGFQLCEHVFCAFFVVELLIRYGAFRATRLCLQDTWFMFDFALVVLMVIDTWIFNVLLTALSDPPNTGAAGGIGRMFRLLRLTRISRLMHMIPELVTMVKGMIAAVRAVHAALLILMLLVYVFAIIFHMLVGEEESVQEYFPNVRSAMVTLLVQGVLLDEISGLTRTLIELGNPVAVATLALFVLLSALTVMNMLIGVLCEVVLDVSAAETESQVKADMTKSLLVMLQNLDADGSGHLSKEEVLTVIQDPEAVAILNKIQVDTQHLQDLAEMLYMHEDTTLPIHTIMNIVLVLRGRRGVTMDDMAKGHNFILWAMEAQMKQQQELMQKTTDGMQKTLQDALKPVKLAAEPSTEAQ